MKYAEKLNLRVNSTSSLIFLHILNMFFLLIHFRHLMLFLSIPASYKSLIDSNWLNVVLTVDIVKLFCFLLNTFKHSLYLQIKFKFKWAYGVLFLILSPVSDGEINGNQELLMRSRVEIF